jgi:hypothetical protein
VKVTICFGSPFHVLTYTVSMLAIGWAIGSHWGSTPAAGWLLLLRYCMHFDTRQRSFLPAGGCRDEGSNLRQGPEARTHAQNGRIARM